MPGSTTGGAPAPNPPAPPVDPSATLPGNPVAANGSSLNPGPGPVSRFYAPRSPPPALISHALPRLEDACRQVPARTPLSPVRSPPIALAMCGSLSAQVCIFPGCTNGCNPIDDGMSDDALCDPYCCRTHSNL